MKLREMTDAAIALICEDPDRIDTDDYKERATFILPTFCGHCSALDDRYRLAHAMKEKTAFSAVCMDLEENFPLADIFLAPATYYLAAMLSVDENEVLSDRFFELYTDAIASVERDLPASIEAISDRYAIL